MEYYNLYLEREFRGGKKFRFRSNSNSLIVTIIIFSMSFAFVEFVEIQNIGGLTSRWLNQIIFKILIKNL